MCTVKTDMLKYQGQFKEIVALYHKIYQLYHIATEEVPALLDGLKAVTDHYNGLAMRAEREHEILTTTLAKNRMIPHLSALKVAQRSLPCPVYRFINKRCTVFRPLWQLACERKQSAFILVIAGNRFLNARKYELFVRDILLSTNDCMKMVYGFVNKEQKRGVGTWDKARDEAMAKLGVESLKRIICGACGEEKWVGEKAPLVEEE